MKNGLFLENGKLVYYQNDLPKHAGVIEVDGAIYYIGSHGRAVKGRHVVHSAMSNGVLKHGTYRFGDDYKLVEGSYVAPEKIKVSSKKKKRSKKLSKNKRVRFVLPTVLAAVIVALIILTDEHHLPQRQANTNKPESEASQAVVNEYVPPISLPTFEEEVLLCSEAAKQVYDNQLTMAEAASTGDPYRGLLFKYNLQGTDGLLLLSENQKLVDAEEYILAKDSTMLVIDNLKTGTTYYYKVKVGNEEYPGSFRTAKSTRFVNIPGAQNTRDIGGYQTLDGKTVKQGLLIRGTELDGLVEPSYSLPISAAASVQDTFSFVYDLDLRQSLAHSGTYSSRLGKEVGHQFYTAPQYGQIFNTQFSASLHNIFSDLANPQNYPMYLHCTWGRDRTGTVIYLLQGLLNMSEQDMAREFCLSGFWHSDLKEPTYMDAVIAGLEPYAGDTLQEKIVTFLTEMIGITDAQIASIRSIFLED